MYITIFLIAVIGEERRVEVAQIHDAGGHVPHNLEVVPEMKGVLTVKTLGRLKGCHKFQ